MPQVHDPVPILTNLAARYDIVKPHGGFVKPMGSIRERRRADGSIGYTAQIILKRKGQDTYREALTFDRRGAATAWLKVREAELKEPGGIERAKNKGVTLADVILRYTRESVRDIGRTKAQVLNSIKAYDIAGKAAGDIRSDDIVAFARDLAKDRKPQTVGNYLSHLGAVFAIARPAWGYPLDQQAMKDAMTVCRRLGFTSKSEKRERRPTLAELDKLMAHFVDRETRRPGTTPMSVVVPFALYSTRRMEEILRIERKDFDAAGKRVLVRDMKNPGEKAGNDVWCDLPREAADIIASMPTQGRIFPYTTDAVGAAFTRACKFLGIEDLHFHDMRHEGVSRLFEMGMNIPHAAAVSGHRSWSSLQRYSHIRQAGDKYAEWKWLPVAVERAKAAHPT